ncbi:MAG: ABC transporter permease [Verrucomicrobiales bacterium]|nr:ABC transporter permease [Verrucomicrobiales bacterium]
MRVFLTLWRREFSSTFGSPVGYVVLAAVLLLLGVSFVLIVDYLNEPSDVPLTELFYGSIFFWVILLLSTPVITMRSFAQERATGTYETLMTTPVSDGQVVFAKFAGAFSFYVLLWIPLLGCLFVVRRYAADDSVLDWGAIASTYLGILSLGTLYISLGVFASALTRNQVIAAIVAIALGVSLFLLSFAAPALAGTTAWSTSVLRGFSLVEQMWEFSRGVVDVRHLVFHLSLAAVFVFLTLKVIEARRWK